MRGAAWVAALPTVGVGGVVAATVPALGAHAFLAVL